MWKKIFILVLVSLITLPALAKKQRRITAAPQTVASVKADVAKGVETQEKGLAQIEPKAESASAPETKKVESKTPVEARQATDEKQTQIVEAHSNPYLWHKGANTVVQLKGQASEDSALCKTFDVKLTDRLDFKIECMGQEVADSLSLQSNSNRTVAQKGEHITITQYNYMTKKPRIAKAKSSTLKVPYVERIIHIKKMPEGEMAFYLESFREDEFGRIVQDGFIQAHSLTNAKIKISAN